MNNTANAHIAAERLSVFTNMLLASGWSSKDVEGEVCWAPPEHIQVFAALEYGNGHIHLWDALSLQTRMDVATSKGWMVAA